MSEMDAPPKMEQFWEDPPAPGQNHSMGGHGINPHGSGGHGNNHGGGGHHNSSAVASTGSSSGASGGSQYERNLNFATGAVEENEYGFPKKKTIRDPLSHRIIEKRRRDRMNNCLADLARLLPPSSLRKGRGRIEKTEIVELAIKHLRHLQCHPCSSGDKCEFNYIVKSSSKNNAVAVALQSSPSPGQMSSGGNGISSTFQSTPEEHFRLGFHECMSETMHFLVEKEGMYPGDSLCVRILKHLRTHSENLIRDHFGKDGKLPLVARPKEEGRIKSTKTNDATSEFSGGGGTGGSICSGYLPNGSSSGSDGNGGPDVEGTESFVLPVPNASQGPSSTADRDRTGANFEYEGENSCCSTQLSLDISDVFSVESKNTARSTSKPPIPTIICSSSSIHSSPAVNSSSNGRSSDEGQEGPDGSISSKSSHRYKFKNNIKQRFNADSHDNPRETNQTSSSGRKGHATKASLKQNDESPSDIVGNSDNDDEEAAMKLRNRSPVEMDDDCISSKSYPVVSSRRNSSTTNNSLNTRSIEAQAAPAGTTGRSTSLSTKSHSSSTEHFMAIAPYSGTDRELRDIKLTREELLKTLAARQLDKSALPILLGDAAGNDSKAVGVPAFALHDKGLYYVPLTIDKSILSPYLAKLEPNTSPPLHPVTISVCFLLSQADKLRKHDEPDCKDLAPVQPILNHISPELIPIPVTLPIVTTTAAATVTPIKIKSPKANSSCKEPSNNFIINRFSQSRQYSPGSYRYPITTTAAHITAPHMGPGPGPILPSPQNLSQKDHNMSHPQCYPGYYPSTETHHSTGQGLLPLPPAHMAAGYGSSSSSSSSCSSNPSRNSRKRSIASMSPMSGSSSLGYHSFHDKYSPNTQEFYGYPQHQQNTHPSPVSHSHNNHSHNNYGHSVPNINHHHHLQNYGATTNHLVPFHEEKHIARCNDTEVSRRSCSPNKRAKRSREQVDEVLKPKPLPIGLPIIPLPPSEQF